MKERVVCIAFFIAMVLALVFCLREHTHQSVTVYDHRRRYGRVSRKVCLFAMFRINVSGEHNSAKVAQETPPQIFGSTLYSFKLGQ